MESSSSMSAAAAAAVASASMILEELRRQSQQLGERDALLFNTLEQRQIQREQERDEQARRESAALSQNVESWLDQRIASNQTAMMDELASIREAGENNTATLAAIRAIVGENQLSCNQTQDSMASIKAAVKENTSKLSSLQQTMESVQTTVNNVESTGKETKQDELASIKEAVEETKKGVAAIRAIVGKNELTCNQTKELVASFGTELAVLEERVPVPSEAIINDMAAQIRSYTQARIDDADDDNEEEEDDEEEIENEENEEEENEENEEEENEQEQQQQQEQQEQEQEQEENNNNNDGDDDNDNNNDTVHNNNKNKRQRRFKGGNSEDEVVDCNNLGDTEPTAMALPTTKKTIVSEADMNATSGTTTAAASRRPDWGHLVPDSDSRLRYDGRPNNIDRIGVDISVAGPGQDQWEGWWKQSIERSKPEQRNGTKKLIDHYWYAPDGTKLRSISQVRKFLLRSNDSVAVAVIAAAAAAADDNEQPPPNDDAGGSTTYNDDGHDKPSERFDFSKMLYAMLEDCTFNEDFSKIVSWQPHGLAFKVHNREEMDKILPRWFTMKYESWCKQLERWGFWKLRRDKNRDCWYHTNFVHRSSYVHARDAYKQMSKNDFSESMPDYLSAREEPDLDTLSTEDNKISHKQKKRKAGVIDQANTGNNLK